MKKVRVSKGEWYPMYSFCEDDGDPTDLLIEISDEEFDAWNELDKQFMALQHHLSRIYEKEE